jgi:hypothetical protein
MSHPPRKVLVVLAALGVLAVGGSQIAGAAAKKSTKASTTQSGTSSKGGNGETVLTGATLTSVTDAVVAAYPGATVDRASTETDGKSTDAYEAKVTKSDGTKIEVFLDSSFAVTGEAAQKARP